MTTAALAVALVAIFCIGLLVWYLDYLMKVINADRRHHEEQRARDDQAWQSRLSAHQRLNSRRVAGAYESCAEGGQVLYGQIKELRDKDMKAVDELLHAEREQWQAAIAAITPLPAPPLELSPQERGELQARWRQGTEELASFGIPTGVCPDCYLMHGGICLRVAELVTERKGGTVTTTKKYWPNDKWQPPAEAMTGSAIFGGPAPQPPQQQGGPPDAASTQTRTQ